MCGIAGFWDRSNAFSDDHLKDIAARMANTLSHRGPDDFGTWVDAEAGIALGHRRLAVIDLSPLGRQPMHSADKRYVVIFNGEIYNYQHLRRELIGLGHSFAGNSDTEVLLAAILQWGPEDTLARLNGMFAFALWDRRQRTLWLSRDRFGEKPLYYGLVGDTFLFGSELKALRAHPLFHCDIDRSALTLYVRYNYIPAPYSIFRGVYKLPPGAVLRFGLSDRKPRVSTYWSFRKAVERGAANPFRGSPEEAVVELEDLLRDAIKIRMVADVAVGAFLSGGIDSSTTVALMQAQSSHPVKTFTIGFHEEDYNEAQHARAVAEHLGTAHTELYVTPEEAREVIPRLPSLYDEPFADPSQIPTHLVCRLARQSVTVALSGDAGDELFGGYARYPAAFEVWQQMSRTSGWARKVAARMATLLPPHTWDRLLGIARPLLPEMLRRNPGQKLHRLADITRSRRSEEVYHRFMSYWDKPSTLIIGGAEPPTLFSAPERVPNLPSFFEHMMYLDTLTYLPDDILVKVDRASMGVSLEVRVPFLDPRVVELAWRLPLSLRIREGISKWILRKILYQYVPRELVERPKMGFGVPIGEWLVGPLRPWAESLLDERRLCNEGFFVPEIVRQIWREHQAGSRDWQYQLWGILMFQAWHEATRRGVI